MKTFKFSLVLRTRENTDVFISLDDNIYGIHRKRINILYTVRRGQENITKYRKTRLAASFCAAVQIRIYTMTETVFVALVGTIQKIITKYAYVRFLLSKTGSAKLRGLL